MRRASRLFLRTLVMVILAWGALAVIARLATPLLDQNRGAFAEWLSEQAGVTVRIARLQAIWYGPWPRLRLHEISLGGDQSGGTLYLDRADLDLTPLALLKDGISETLRLTLSGLQLNLRREANGQIHLVGLPRPGTGDQRTASGPDIGAWLPKRLRLRQVRLRWEDRLVDASPLLIDNLDLDLQRDGLNMQLRATLDSQLGRIDLAADLRGFLSMTDWSGSSYLKIRDLRLAELAAAYLPEHYRIEGARTDLELWQQWNRAVSVDTRGRFALTKASLANAQQPPHQVRLAHIGARFHYRRQHPDQWQLQLDQLQVTPTTETAWPVGRLAVKRWLEDGQPRMRATADYLELESLATLLLIRAPTQQAETALRELNPRGRIRDLRLELAPGTKLDWAINARFEGLALSAWRDIPGIANLGGQLAGKDGHAVIALDARELPIDYHTLFRFPLHLTRLSGDLHLLTGENGWQLLSEQLRMDTPHFRSTTRFSASGGGSGSELRLISDMTEGDVSATSRYLPAAIMGDELVEWLDRSLSAGRIETTTALVSGPLDTFPYDTVRNGAFEVVVLTRDTPLDYQRGWPSLREVDARLEFHENSLDMELLKGHIYDSEIQQAQARILSLDPTSSLLMRGRLSGPLRDEISLLREDALREDFGHIAEALTVRGNAELSLDFEVPLVKGRGEYRLDGNLRFDNAVMSLAEWDLDISQIKGKLGITLDALTANGIKGRAMGSAVSVDVLPQGRRSTRVRAKARLSSDAIARRLPELPMELAAGEADFTIDLDVPGVSAPAGSPTQLSVSSDLVGMQLDVPHPLGKPAEQSRPLRVDLTVAGNPQPTRIDYGDALHATFSDDWQTGDIRYHRGAPQLPQEQGLHLAADLDRLDLADWQSLMNRLGGPGTGTHEMPSWQADIHARHLSYDDLVLPDTSLAAESDHAWVRGGLLSPSLKGRFDYPLLSDRPLRVQLDEAHIAFDTEPGDDQDVSEAAYGPPPLPSREPDPRALPPIDLTCANLTINQADLGKLVLQSAKTEHGMRIDQLLVEGPSGKLTASGAWDWRGDTQHTRLAGAINIPDLGEFQEALGYPRQMHEASVNTGFDLTWPGNPAQIHPATFSGNLVLTTGKGRFAQVNPGITRVIGLLNIDSLSRRLKLDFADLTEKGYSFDSIQGHFTAGDGDIHTNDLVIIGPAGRIEIGGRIGLLREDFDQLVTVTPNLDATLPIAGTLAGGPVGGVAALIAQTLLSKQVDDINRFEYSVTGSWNEPVLSPLSSGGAVSRLVNKLGGKKTQPKTERQEGLIKRETETDNSPLKKLLDSLPPPQSGPEKPFDPLQIID